MNKYRATVKLIITKTVTTHVEVQATDAEKAKLQLEVTYGKRNVVTYPTLVCNK